jgi:hypothetical protein
MKVVLATIFHASFFLCLFFGPEYGRRHVPLKSGLTFNGLNGVISQKIELFNFLLLCTSLSYGLQ